MESKIENYIICDECGGKMMTNICDQDSRGYIYCRGCGLVHDPNHEMGNGISGLIGYMNHKGLNDHIESTRQTYTAGGLTRARLMVSKL